MQNNIVIIGSGISGLLSALILSENQNYNIHIIEKKDILGGLHGYFDYGEFGRFDYGAHNILESGLAELDNLLINLLPIDEWNITSAVNEQKRTLTGIYYNGKLQKNTSCIDLRYLPLEEKTKYLNNLINANKNEYIFNNPDLISAYDYSISLFGEEITNNIISNIFKNIFGIDLKELNKMVFLLLGISRICLLDKEELENLYLTDTKTTKRLCYPEQREIPKNILSSLKAYYPKKFGMYRIIDAIKEKLDKRKNVKIYMKSEINEIGYSHHLIDYIKINNFRIDNISHLISSININNLAKMLKIDTSDLKYDKAPQTVLNNLLIDKPLEIGDLSYFYCYDKEFKTFRVDNYYNYCGEGAKRKNLFPITVEMLIDDNNIDKEYIEKLVKKELSIFGILKENTKIEFIQTEILEYGFPLLTQKNINSFNIIRERIDSLGLENLIKIGILSKKDLFFEGEIKIDLYNQLINLKDKK